jgi:hypothetical protein
MYVLWFSCQNYIYRNRGRICQEPFACRASECPESSRQTSGMPSIYFWRLVMVFKLCLWRYTKIVLNLLSVADPGQNASGGTIMWAQKPLINTIYRTHILTSIRKRRRIKFTENHTVSNLNNFLEKGKNFCNIKSI